MSSVTSSIVLHQGSSLVTYCAVEDMAVTMMYAEGIPSSVLS